MMENQAVSLAVVGVVYRGVDLAIVGRRAGGRAVYDALELAVYRAVGGAVYWGLYQALYTAVAPHKEPIHPGLALYLGGVT